MAIKNLDAGKFGTIWHKLSRSQYGPSGWTALELIGDDEGLISPIANALQYGLRCIFEGMMAERLSDGRIAIFRPYDHWVRFNKSAEVVGLPAIPEDIFVNAIELVLKQAASQDIFRQSSTIYIRPTMANVTPALSPGVGGDIRFHVALFPFKIPEDNTMTIFLELHRKRIAQGADGDAKISANYSVGAFADMVRQKGYSKILWTANGNDSITELTTMNVFFVCNRGGSRVIITPELNSEILPGITRATLFEIAEVKNLEIIEEMILPQSLFEYARKGELLEIFGTGTASMVTSGTEILLSEDDNFLYRLPENDMAKMFMEELTKLRRGSIEHYVHIIEPEVVS